MSNKIPKIITGSENRHIATWKVGGQVTAVSPSATVQFILTSREHDTPYTTILTANSTDDGADWTAGKIRLIFPASDTDSETPQGAAEVQVQVSDPNPMSAFYTVNIIKGNI